MRLLDALQIIKDRLKADPIIKWKGTLEGDIREFDVLSSYIRKMLGVEFMLFEEGLDKTIKYYGDNAEK